MARDNNHIISLIEERLEKGKREYNQEVDVHDGRDWLQEAVEELLDACVYLSAQIIKLKERRANEYRSNIDRRTYEFSTRYFIEFYNRPT